MAVCRCNFSRRLPLRAADKPARRPRCCVPRDTLFISERVLSSFISPRASDSNSNNSNHAESPYRRTAGILRAIRNNDNNRLALASGASNPLSSILRPADVKFPSRQFMSSSYSSPQIPVKSRDTREGGARPPGRSTPLAAFTRARKIAAAGRTKREITVARALGSQAGANPRIPPPLRRGYRLLLLAAYPPMDTSLTGSLTPVERAGFLSYVTITHT